MWNDSTEVIRNFYGMEAPDIKHMKLRMKKVAEAIEKMGDKYCLSIKITKLEGVTK